MRPNSEEKHLTKMLHTQKSAFFTVGTLFAYHICCFKLFFPILTLILENIDQPTTSLKATDAPLPKFELYSGYDTLEKVLTDKILSKKFRVSFVNHLPSQCIYFFNHKDWTVLLYFQLCLISFVK